MRLFRTFMRRPLGLLTVIIGCILAASGSAGPRPSSTLPFEVHWTNGVCRNCQTARTVGSIAFARGRDVWALGYNPPGEAGAGDYSVLHSVDGGRIWRELHGTFQHNSAPDVSFASPNDGLIRLFDVTEASPELLITHDAGRSWRRVSTPDAIDQVQYMGHGQAAAYSNNIYSKATGLHTADNLEHAWHYEPLPVGFWPSALRFTEPQRGVLGGCLDHHLAVLATSDWGEHWSTSLLDAPIAVTKTGSGCDAEISGIAVAQRENRWLLAQRTVYPLGGLKGFMGVWRSEDAGAHWTSVFREEDSGPPEDYVFFDGPFLLGDDIIILSKHGPVDSHSIVYSTDQGAHWSEAPFRSALDGCAPSGGGLICAGRDFSTAFLSPRRKTPTGR